ncbi:hypothetical protein SEA_PICKLES13_52 [Microbacterium phage Pickles13]|nr:hypothetical protein SEA_PICKLES13_52 [Microbacterium phage Pickles13]
MTRRKGAYRFGYVIGRWVVVPLLGAIIVLSLLGMLAVAYAFIARIFGWL